MSAHQPPTTTTAGGNGQASKLSIRMPVNSRQITRCYRGSHQGLWGSTWLFTPSAGQSVPSASFEYHQEPPASHLLLSLLTPHNPAALTVVPRDFFVTVNGSQGSVLVPDCLVARSSVGCVSTWYRASLHFFCSIYRDVKHACPRPHSLLGSSIRQGTPQRCQALPCSARVSDDS
jgi:hypothetical protein